MNVAKGASLRAEIVVLAAGNALASSTFSNCTCPKPKGFKSVADIEAAIAGDKPGREKLDTMLTAGHTVFVRRTFLFNPEHDANRLMKKDEWILINPANGDEVRLTSPIARAYGHLKATKHLDEQHTDHTKTAAEDRKIASRAASWIPENLAQGIPSDEPVLVDIPLSALSVSQRALDHAGRDCLLGMGSRTQGPIRVFYNTDNRQFLIEDGMHRLFEATQKKQRTIPAELWSGYSDVIANVYDPIKL